MDVNQEKSKKNGLAELMRGMMEKVGAMAEQNTVIGTPVTTEDGVTLIPVSRVSVGLGSGGTEYGGNGNFAGGGGAGAKIEPVSFVVVKDGTVRVIPVAVPAANSVERILDMVPNVVEKVENIVATKRETNEP